MNRLFAFPWNVYTLLMNPMILSFPKYDIVLYMYSMLIRLSDITAYRTKYCLSSFFN